MKQVFRSFFKKGKSSIIKIISLGMGLAIGFVLISKVFFEVSYDDFHPEIDNIYRINTLVSSQGAEEEEYGQVSGAIAPGFKDYLPGVVVATRFTSMGSGTYYDLEKNEYSGQMRCVDSNFLKIFPREILAGDSKALGEPYKILVSRSFAEKMGGISQAMEKTIYRDDMRDLKMPISGVFEDFPKNSSLQYDILLSLASYSQWSRENWVGNDRYQGYVILADNVDPYSDEMAKAIRRMQEENQPIEEIEASGTTIEYVVKPFATYRSSDPDLKRMNILLAFLAFALIFTAIMNYILFEISSLVDRAKEIGMRKCYGAQGRNIAGIILNETLFYILMSLVVAWGVILASQKLIEELLGADLSTLFTAEIIGVLFGICILIFILAGVIPAYLFNKVPVTAAFRNYKESRRRWKLALLFCQFTATALLLSLLLIIVKQHDRMVNDDPGYSYENLVYCGIRGIEQSELEKIVDELKRLPNVDMVEGSYGLPIHYASGNNVLLPNDNRELFNIADQYWHTSGYFDMLDIEILEGVPPKTSKEIVVSRSFVENMNKFTDWKDGAVGKQVRITEHSQGSDDFFTISGVYEDYRIGSIQNQDNRPSAIFYTEMETWSLSYLLVKLHNIDSESINEINEILIKSLPNIDVQLQVYSEEIRALYLDSRNFRDSVIIVGIVTLLIALMGLMGYTRDETNRRRGEIAIRKINGAVLKEILSLFVVNILKIAIPSVIIGCIAALMIGQKWLEQFSEKIALSPWIFILSGSVVLIIICVIVTLNCIRIANSNPVDSLKSE